MTIAFYNPPAVASYPAVISGVLMAAPSGANPAGNYVQLFGSPPPGIALGDVFYWSGSAAILLTTYAQTGGVFQTSSGETWFKIAGTWAKEVTSVSLLASAPVGATSAGLYAMTAGTPPSGVALGDLFYWSGAAATRYIAFASAPDTIVVGGQTHAKTSAPTYWKNVVAQTITTFSEPLTITGTTSNPVLGTTYVNLIDVVDDGSGWCELSLNFEKPSGGSAGSGDYLITLPGGLKFNSTFHPGRAIAGDPLMAGLFSWIPGSHGMIANANLRMSAYAMVWDATRFRILIGSEAIYSSIGAIRSPWGAYFTLSDFTSVQMAFRFKKG